MSEQDGDNSGCNMGMLHQEVQRVDRNVIRTTEALSQKIESLQITLQKHQLKVVAEIAGLKVKAALMGAFAGLIPSFLMYWFKSTGDK